MTFSVGQRLREIRQARGLSQRALAARSGVTNGTISMAEQDTTSPSVASLKKILDGIPMSLSDFFNAPESARPQTFFKADELRELTPPGSDERTTLISLRQVGDGTAHSIQMLYERYEPGADTGEEKYTHAGEEAGIVVSGSIEITVEDTIRTLNPGDAYLFESRRPHRFRNPGKAECIIISACTPPSF